MIPDPECESGYPWSQIETFLGVERTEELMRWMRGQTMTLCEGRRYSHDTEDYSEKCGGVAHGPVVYAWDLERFMRGGPILD